MSSGDLFGRDIEGSVRMDEKLQPSVITVDLEKVIEVSVALEYALREFKALRKICDRYIEKMEETLKRWESERNG